MHTYHFIYHYLLNLWFPRHFFASVVKLLHAIVATSKGIKKQVDETHFIFITEAPQ